MKKPNRFERVAQKCIDKHFEDCPIGCRLHSSIVAQLLRQEHAATVRMVRNGMKSGWPYPFDAVQQHAWKLACEHILDRLARSREDK